MDKGKATAGETFRQSARFVRNGIWKNKNKRRRTETMTNHGELSRRPPFETYALDEEEVRLTAYFLWEQSGRPIGNDEYYWWGGRREGCEKTRRRLSFGAKPKIL
jgi:hypothetical protein